MEKSLIVDSDDLFMLSKTEIGLDQADLFCIKFLAEHCFVVADKVVIDVSEIEHADSHCGFAYNILLVED